MAAPLDPLPVTAMINMVSGIKLGAANYLPWRRQIERMADCFDLTGFLDGSVAAPSPTVPSADGVPTPNPAFTTWKAKDRKLLSVMYTSLSVEAANEVLDATTARETWVTLESVFSSPSRQHHLREELLSLRRGDSSVEEYGKKFKDLSDQLLAIKCPVSESDKSHWFLRGLGVRFASFADTRMALSPIPTFRDLLSQAKQYDSMLRAMEGSTPQAAFSADRQPQHGRSSSGGRAHHSGNGGPHGQQSWSSGGRGQSSGGRGQSSGSNNGGRRPYVPRCQICRGEHYADKCPQFLSAKQAVSSAHLAQAFQSSCNVSDSNPNWYLDSGASAHMTNQTTALDSYEPYSEPRDAANSGSGKV